jgi:hypothetical protein
MTTRDWYRKFTPRAKISKLAIDLVCVVNDNAISPMEGADLLTVPVLVDVELQELRAFVNDVAALETDPGDEYQLGQRARQLAERLRVG